MKCRLRFWQGNFWINKGKTIYKHDTACNVCLNVVMRSAFNENAHTGIHNLFWKPLIKQRQWKHVLVSLFPLRLSWKNCINRPWISLKDIYFRLEKQNMRYCVSLCVWVRKRLNCSSTLLCLVLIESQKYRVSLFAIVYAIKRLTLNCSCASQGQGGCWSMLRKLVSNFVRRVQNSLS